MDTTLQNKIEQLYGTPIVDVEQLSGLGGGSIYVLHAPTGKKSILKQHNPALTQKRLAFQHSIIQGSRSKGLLIIPEVYPIVTQHVDGITLSDEHSTFFTYQDKNFGVYEFKEGNFYSGNNNELRDVARVLALFHMHLKPYVDKDYLHTGKFLELSDKLEQLERQTIEAEVYAALNPELIKELRDISPVIKDYKKSIERVSTDSAYEQLFADFTVIHGDFHQKNTLFLDDRINAILDLDSVRRDRRVYEVASALFEFTSIYIEDDQGWRFDRLDPEKASLFIEEYQQHNPLQGAFLDGMYIMLMERFLVRLSYGLKQVKEGNKEENDVIKEMLNTLNRLPSSYDEAISGMRHIK